MTKDELKELEGQIVWVLSVRRVSEFPNQAIYKANNPLQGRVPPFHKWINCRKEIHIPLINPPGGINPYFHLRDIFRTRKEALIALQKSKESQVIHLTAELEHAKSELAEVNRALEVEG